MVLAQGRHVIPDIYIPVFQVYRRTVVDTCFRSKDLVAYLELRYTWYQVILHGVQRSLLAFSRILQCAHVVFGVDVYGVGGWVVGWEPPRAM